ncbi:T9SS type A sorting domain-containing protein [Bacteroidota bacterium]
MQVLIFSFLLIFFSESFCQNYPHLFDLQGLEDNQGNTHLFYRYGGANTICWKKDIYHLDRSTNIDTVYIRDNGYIVYPGGSCEGVYVYDYEFFDSDPNKFIYCGYDLWIDPIAELVRYDGEIQIEAFSLTEIEISKQDENLVYVSGSSLIFKSTDGGYNYSLNYDSLALIDDAIISLSKNDHNQIYGIHDNKLVRSEDEGYSYTIVDDYPLGGSTSKRELYYDFDGQHIYYVVISYSESTLRISDNNGNSNSWSEIVTTPAKMSFTLDEANTGEIYYSYRKGIYKSTDYGASFSLYKELDQKITGLYKKSGSNILYASTALKIYEIKPDSAITIKNLPTPPFIYNWFPMEIGNHWVYEIFISDGGEPEYLGDETRSIIGLEALNNGHIYFLYKMNFINGDSDTTFIRTDSSSAKLYAYSFGLETDLLFDNLLAEAGDTVCYEYNPAWGCQYVQTETPIQIFGLNKLKKEYSPQAPGFYFGHTLVNGLGLYEVYNGDLTPFRSTLKGCVIDGVLYGDTTVVSVDNENPFPPTEFSLSQNYPNPFNPSTSIQYTVGSRQFVTLKVYDVLGNEVATLVNEEKSVGSYEVEFNQASGIWYLVSGVYFYRLQANEYVETKKMVLLR